MSCYAQYFWGAMLFSGGMCWIFGPASIPISIGIIVMIAAFGQFLLERIMELIIASGGVK